MLDSHWPRMLALLFLLIPVPTKTWNVLKLLGKKPSLHPEFFSQTQISYFWFNFSSNIFKYIPPSTSSCAAKELVSSLITQVIHQTAYVIIFNYFTMLQCKPSSATALRSNIISYNFSFKMQHIFGHKAYNNSPNIALTYCITKTLRLIAFKKNLAFYCAFTTRLIC